MKKPLINKKLILKILGLLIFSISVFLLVYFNSSAYSQPIGKILSIDNQDGTQYISAKLLNGEEKGQTIKISHTYNSSLVYDDYYHQGDFLFLSQSEDSSYHITGLKRDYYIALVLLILFDLLILVGGRQGLFTTLGLGVNILLFYGALRLYLSGYNVLVLSIILTIIFSFLLLLLINGLNKVTLLSLFATLGAISIIGIISSLIIYLGPPISYEFMEYMPEPFTRHQANYLLISEILIGGLGVIMDVSVTISSAGMELIRKTPSITPSQVKNSCKKVADDITGTMINVVLLTNIAAFIPVFTISIENGFRASTILKNNLFFEVTRFLTGSIGIVLVIPLTIFVVLWVHKRGKTL